MIERPSANGSSELLEAQRTRDGRWSQGHSGSPSTRFGQPGGNRPGRKPGRTLGDVLEAIRTAEGDDDAAQALYRVAADPTHPHWPQAQRILWNRTDGPVNKNVIERNWDGGLKTITLVHDRTDAPLPLPEET